MRFDILTIFPKIFQSYFSHSLMARAQKKGFIKIAAHDLRKFAKDKHRTVDDRPYGGGVGMIMKINVVHEALKDLMVRKATGNRRPEGPRAHRGGLKDLKTKIILLTPQGKVFNQKHARRLAKYDRLILISGRYEGYDERIRKFVDEEISIGDYVLTGGELPAMVVIDAVARLVPGVVGKQESLEEESFNRGFLEYPHYTRPPEYRDMKVPKVLLSGNHAAVKKWREEQALKRTKKRRPDLLKSSMRHIASPPEAGSQ